MNNIIIMVMFIAVEYHMMLSVSLDQPRCYTFRISNRCRQC